MKRRRRQDPQGDDLGLEQHPDRVGPVALEGVRVTREQIGKRRQVIETFGDAVGNGDRVQGRRLLEELADDGAIEDPVLVVGRRSAGRVTFSTGAPFVLCAGVRWQRRGAGGPAF